VFPDYNNAMGLLGWIVTLLVWTGLVALTVWAITWLFPNPPRAAAPRQWSSPRPGGSPVSRPGRRRTHHPAAGRPVARR
jgi:hypothetical protein